jgi:hypothetical protein
MRQHPIYQKALKSNKISKEEAVLFFDGLYKDTDAYIKKEFRSYVLRGNWPLKARIPNGAQKDPVFCVLHHTSNRERKHKPALHRFLSSEKASSNFVITDDGTIIYLVRLVDASYHATKGWMPIALARALKVNDGRWLNECGVELCGNGMLKLFKPEALEATIVLHRLICAYFDGTIKEIKSHRFFAAQSRSGDPGVYSFLPLLEHATFNDVDLSDNDYWLAHYKADQVKFANESATWIEKYGVADRDEWKDRRKRMKATAEMMK